MEPIRIVVEELASSQGGQPQPPPVLPVVPPPAPLPLGPAFQPSVPTSAFGEEWAVVNGRLERRAPQVPPAGPPSPLLGPAFGSPLPGGFDPAAVARQQVEQQRAQDDLARQARQMQEAVAREREKLQPFDPAAEARSRLDETRRQQEEAARRRERESQVAREMDRLAPEVAAKADPAEEVRRRSEDQRKAFEQRTDLLRAWNADESNAKESARQQREEEALLWQRRAALNRERTGAEGAALEEARRSVEEERAGRDWSRRVTEARRSLVSAAEEAREGFSRQSQDWQRSFDVRRAQQQLPGAAAEQARQGLAEQEAARDWARQVQRERDRQDPRQAGLRDLEAGGRLINQATPGGSSFGRALMQSQELAKVPEAVAGLGEAGGLAAAAGPLGAALYVAQEAAGAVARTFESLKDKVNLLGSVVVSLAGNDHLGMFNKVVDGASKSLESIPVVGKLMAEGLQAAVAPVRVFADVVDAFVTRGRQLESYSGALAAANAQADVRSLLADIREADALGPDLARLTDASSRFTDELRELVLPIKKAVVELLTGAMERITGMLEGMHNYLAALRELGIGIMKIMVNLATFNFADAAKQIGDTLENIQNALEEQRKPKENFDPLGIFKNLELGDLGPVAGPGAFGAGFAPPPIAGGF